MRSRCAAQGCSFDRTGMYKNNKAWRILHPFPDDIAMRLSWMQASGNLMLLEKSFKSIRDGYYICTAHFESKDYKNPRHLKHTAVPKIFSHEGPIPYEMFLEYAIRNNVEKYLNPQHEAIVPPVSAIWDHNYYISEVTDLGTTHGGQESVIANKLVNNSVEDSIIFVQPNIDGSNPGNPDEASTLREELQTMESHEVSNWFQITEDVDCAEIVMNPQDEIDPISTAKWKHCKQYRRKKNISNSQQDPFEKHKEYMKMKKELTVNLSYINVQNQSTVPESGDPMSRLVNVDESRSLMTQEYVSSVLSALDTDLSYSVFDREKVKPVEVAVTAPLSPRQRDPDCSSPGPINVAGREKPTKPVGVTVTIPTTGIPTTVPRYQIVEQRPSSPPPLIPFKRQSEPHIENCRIPVPQLRIENPRTLQIDVPATVDVSNEGSIDMEVDEYTSEEPVKWRSLPDNLCRVCAKTCESLEYVFSDEGQTLHLADLIHTHLPIMITPDDLLPTHICASCITGLQAADSLVRTCMEADNTLRGLLDLTQNTQVQLGDSNSYDNDDNGYEDNIFTQENDEADNTPKTSQKTDKNNSFSHLLSQDDVSLINKMKGDGLKVTLVRVPNLNDLPEEKKHQRVLQVLRSMNATKSVKRKSLGTINLKTDPTNRETANISPVDDVLQDIAAGSALRDTEPADISETRTIPNRSSELQAEAVPEVEPKVEPKVNPPIVDLSAIPLDPSSSSPDPSKIAGFAPNISISAGVPSLLRNELLDGINYAIKQGHVAKTGSIIKLNCKQDDAASSSSSVYVYVRNKDTQVNPQQIPRKILDLDILHEHQRQQQRLKEKRAASKVAKHQAAIARRRARLREKRRLISERKTLTCEECGVLFKTKEEVAEHRMEHLKCRYCDKQFTKKPSLVEHERVHTKEKPFICDQCGRAFRTRSQMMQHAQRHNTDCPYMCQVCGQQFAVRNTYMAHVNRHSSEAPYLCEMCGKCFKVQVALRLHRLTHRSFNCNICDKVFSYRAYQIHKKSHAGDESKYPCTYCNKKFLTVHRLKIHMLIHEATYPFSCSVCKRSFKRMTHLQAHHARHTPDQLEGVAFFCCAICQTQFEQPSHLSQHFKTHTEDERQALRAYKCDTCNKCFSLERELRTHELRHAGKQTFSCGTCNRAFDTKKEFDKHSDTHTEEKPFACEICGKRFRALINLNNHNQIHLSFKPYPCQSCPKAFKTINGLNQHKVVHSDVRKHTCSICSMGFKRRDAMKNHERTHFAERPYACSVCGRAFKVKADCSTHLKRHRESGIEGTIMESCYTCPVCSATFTLKMELSTHVQNAHDLEVAVLDKDDNLVLVPDEEIF